MGYRRMLDHKKWFYYEIASQRGRLIFDLSDQLSDDCERNTKCDSTDQGQILPAACNHSYMLQL